MGGLRNVRQNSESQGRHYSIPSTLHLVLLLPLAPVSLFPAPLRQPALRASAAWYLQCDTYLGIPSSSPSHLVSFAGLWGRCPVPFFRRRNATRRGMETSNYHYVSHISLSPSLPPSLSPHARRDQGPTPVRYARNGMEWNRGRVICLLACLPAYLLLLLTLSGGFVSASILLPAMCVYVPSVGPGRCGGEKWP
ncbi:hypothetical protein BKA81DRAFT_204248 [Phyllosticta paracitricarpa]